MGEEGLVEWLFGFISINEGLDNVRNCRKLCEMMSKSCIFIVVKKRPEGR